MQQQQQPALLSTGGGGEYECAMEDALMWQWGFASLDAPRFDGTDYDSWQWRMKICLKAINHLVWRIVETGFSSVDEANPTALELGNMYLNAQAMNAIYCALGDDQLYRIWQYETAKEVWDALQVIHEDTPTVRRLKIKQLTEKMKLFAWKKRESADEMFSRLRHLAIEMNRLGCKEVDDSYVVWTMLRAMMPRTPAFVTFIRQVPGFGEITPLEVLHNFEVYEMRQEQSRRITHGRKVDTEPACVEGCSGEAPHFDGEHYLSWQRRMKFYLLSIDPLMWRIVETGFSCADEANPTALEEKNQQHDSRASYALRRAMGDDQYGRIFQYQYKSAKEIWDALRKSNEAVVKSKLSLLRIDMDWFVLGEDESPNDMYTRLNDLANEMKGLGCKEMTDSYLVEKMLFAMTPRNPTLVFLIHQKHDFELLTPQEVLAIFLLYGGEQKESKIVSGYDENFNAALKAKQVQVEESSDDDNDHDQDQEQIQQVMQEVSLFVKKYAGLLGKKGYEARSNFSDNSKTRKSKRYCYQCGDSNHFIADCPKKEDKKEEKEKSNYKRELFNNKGKSYKPDGKKGVGVMTSDDQVTEPWKLKRGLVPKLPTNPAAQPAQQHYCLSARLVHK